jgi:hypothetical protein
MRSLAVLGLGQINGGYTGQTLETIAFEVNLLLSASRWRSSAVLCGYLSH